MRPLFVTCALGWILSLVACGSSEPAEPEESFCLYESGVCHYSYSEVIGNSIYDYESTCPAPESEYVTECQDLYEGGSCAGLDGQSTMLVDSAEFLTVKRNARQVDGGTCDDWMANPNSFDDPASPGGSTDDDDDGSDDASGTGGSTAACPFSCPAMNGEEATCWDESVACETVTSCGDDVHGCSDNTQRFDCAADACGTCGFTNSTGDPCAQCSIQKCCESTAECYYDTDCNNCTYATCPTGTNAEYDAFLSCLGSWCSSECAG